MSGTLDFFFEFASTYSYPAAMRVGELARSAGVRVRWRPFLLGPIFKSQGFDTSPFNVFPAKGRYMWHDLARICENLGLPFRRPEPFPQNGLLAARGAATPIAPEGMHRITLEGGASFDLYLIPIHTPSRDHQDYQIVFN